MDFNDLTNSEAQKEHTNKYLINDCITLIELKSYLKLRFKSYRDAGVAAGISENRVRQILIGYCLPKTAKLIYQIANGWNIDPVKLTLLFEQVPELIPASELNNQEETNDNNSNQERTDSENQ